VQSQPTIATESSVGSTAGETLCLTQQIFPLRSDSIQISAFARGGNGRIAGGDAWEMSAARFD
jgi:hypothetical protein